ncbi:MAG TPA: AMP-binding protein [Mycobacteriales bacterium]|jgi:fatty-acyl-CoA synthase|nr:AMP-binding protein [Mycobacteriales bacterium]
MLSPLTRLVGDGAAAVKVLARTGLIAPVRPDRLVGMGLSALRWGTSPAAAYAIGAARDPGRLAVIDERESVTYADVDRRSTAVAHALKQRGVQAGDAVALLARNSAAFVVAQVAISKLGADVLYLNTGFAGPQLGDVLKDEKAAAVIADEEFVPLLDDVAADLPRLVAWSDDEKLPDSIAVLGAEDAPSLPSPGREGRHVILTSGTTGKPKGAARSAPGALAGLVQLVSVLEAIPYRARGVTVLAAPAFHAWGLANLTLGMLLQSTLVMRRRFDPAATLELVEKYDADTLAAVPVMIQRILDLPEEERGKRDTSSLRVVSLSGSALPPSLATKFMDEFGDVLYSLYGSTEVAYVSIAGPADFRANPATAGRVVRGVTVRLVDDKDKDVAPGETGRIFAGSSAAFEGYTNGDDKARLGGLTSTGDVGRFEDGRLFVEGRDDDMIVSGGENVFPAEVEDCLHQHPDVADAAVVGVPDERFGQALVAHVALRGGASVGGDELRAHVKKALANYKVPREVVIHDELPRNETGKVLKRELKEDNEESTGADK